MQFSTLSYQYSFTMKCQTKIICHIDASDQMICTHQH